ncbi:Fc.00g115860.m01.CDS01 [Cosmosporella sp. VM-42]
MLLTMLLLPILKSQTPTQSPPRITIVTYVLATLSNLPNIQSRPLFPSFDSTDVVPWDGANRYNVTKLLGQLFLTKLAEFVDPDDVLINMVEPGFTKGTDISREFKGILGVVNDMMKVIAARPVEKATLTYIDAVVTRGRESHGSFLMHCEIAPLATIAYESAGQTLADQLWEETLDEFLFCGAREIIKSLQK